MLNRLGLQQRVLLGVILGLGILFGLFAYLGNQAVQLSTERTLQERLIMAQIAANYIDEMIKHRLEELQAAARLEALERDDFPLTAKAEALHYTFPAGGSNIETALLLDSTGRILWSEPYLPTLQGRNLASYPQIERVISQGETIVFSVPNTAQDAALKAGTIVLAAPIGKVQDQAHGVVVMTLDPKGPGFSGFIQPIQLGQTGYGEVVNENGIVIAASRPSRPLDEGQRTDHADRFKTLIAKGTAVVSPCHRCHEEQASQNGPPQARDLLAFAPLSKVPWGVAIRQDEEEALAPSRQLQQRLTIFGLIVFPLALGLVVVSTRNVLRPIATLTQASRRIAQGDLTTSVGIIGRRDEVGVLAQSFDEMRQRLHNSQEEVRQQHHALAERTNELTILYETSQALISTLELERVLAIIVSKTQQTFPQADVGVLFLADPEGRLVARASFGLSQNPPPYLVLARQEMAEDLDTSLVFAPLPTALWEALPPEFRDKTPFVQPRARLLVPLLYEDKVIGSLLLHSFQEGASFTEADGQLLQALANQGSIAIQNARLFQEASTVATLKELDRLRGEFVARVSHELRTPLTSIKSLTETLLRPDLSLRPIERRQFLENIDEATDRLARTINDLLTLSRVEAGRLEIRRIPMAVGPLVEKVVAQFRPQAKDRSFHLELARHLPYALADPDRVGDVVHNLLSNAVKYSPAGKPLTISVRFEIGDGAAVPSRLVISVTDQGIGIPHREFGKLFQRFSQVNGTPAAGGVGLGLYICRTYVEAMGGAIWVDSRPGQGSTFSFSLPVTAVSPTPEATPQPYQIVPEGRTGQGLILVIDDETDVLRTLQLNLGAQGYQTMLATNGEDGLAMAQRYRPDAIILDVVMPGIDGFEAARRLRQHPRTRHIPFLFITALAQEQDEARGRELGAAAYIRKPFSPSAVAQVLGEVLQRQANSGE